MTYYLPKEKVRKVKNLLANKEGEQDPEPEPVQTDEIVSHWHRVGRCCNTGTAVGDSYPELNFGLGLGFR